MPELAVGSGKTNSFGVLSAEAGRFFVVKWSQVKQRAYKVNDF